MIQDPRRRISGATIYFTVSLFDHRQSLLTDHIALLRSAVREVRMEHPFDIDAWVVLPNHMHAVWCLPQGDRAYGQRWGKIKSKFTRALRKGKVVSQQEMRHATEIYGHAGIWQPRFRELHIRSEDERQAWVRHCWHNPVKHGYVARPQDWPFSSIHRDMPPRAIAAE